MAPILRQFVDNTQQALPKEEVHRAVVAETVRVPMQAGVEEATLVVVEELWWADPTEWQPHSGNVAYQQVCQGVGLQMVHSPLKVGQAVGSVNRVLQVVAA